MAGSGDALESDLTDPRGAGLVTVNVQGGDERAGIANFVVARMSFDALPTITSTVPDAVVQACASTFQHCEAWASRTTSPTAV